MFVWPLENCHKSPLFFHTMFRFLQFFSQSLVGRELTNYMIKAAVEIIRSEYEIRKENDNCRVKEIEKLMSKEDHSFNHFFVGR